MCKDDGWFIRHVEPPNACRPSDNPTDRLAIGVCADKYVTIDPVCERVALSARSLQKSSMSASASRTSLYDEITANLIAEFEADRVPWV
jgi:hypothetical protein